ncbi:hypothetical protein J8273_7831 [Carpediemonas membranifera]|uniref:Uncharacterized protein n=1 Tax=Carpediemonas membranifera TaxID=201153 RepID=A0A8J6ASM9_9EUKA|nr:hypothetical protein J8273_7831 [Carpediemonas membranifera]|eukprot:KAG9390480.1 hypothetical protein J8273_7831 [Carpediemonas membranifera]
MSEPKTEPQEQSVSLDIGKDLLDTPMMIVNVPKKLSDYWMAIAKESSAEHPDGGQPIHIGNITGVNTANMNIPTEMAVKVKGKAHKCLVQPPRMKTKPSMVGHFVKNKRVSFVAPVHERATLRFVSGMPEIPATSSAPTTGFLTAEETAELERRRKAFELPEYGGPVAAPEGGYAPRRAQPAPTKAAVRRVRSAEAEFTSRFHRAFTEKEEWSQDDLDEYLASINDGTYETLDHLRTKLRELCLFAAETKTWSLKPEYRIARREVGVKGEQ